MNTTINVPERNRSIKKLLQATYPDCAKSISVTSGGGTAYHWVYVTFTVCPAKLDGMSEIKKADVIAALIKEAGIHLSEFPRDDAGRDYGMLPCLNVSVRR